MGLISAVYPTTHHSTYIGQHQFSTSKTNAIVITVAEMMSTANANLLRALNERKHYLSSFELSWREKDLKDYDKKLQYILAHSRSKVQKMIANKHLLVLPEMATDVAMMDCREEVEAVENSYRDMLKLFEADKEKVEKEWAASLQNYEDAIASKYTGSWGNIFDLTPDQWKCQNCRSINGDKDNRKKCLACEEPNPACLEHRNTGTDLFKRHEPTEDCAVCMAPMPLSTDLHSYKLCCGNKMCMGCEITLVRRSNKPILSRDNFEESEEELNGYHSKCPFCRSGPPTATELSKVLDRMKERSGANDPHETYQLALCYLHGKLGLEKNIVEGINLARRAADELHSIDALALLGSLYCGRTSFGLGAVEINFDTGKEYLERAIDGGSVEARITLATVESMGGPGQEEVAIKHWRLAAMAGSDKALDKVWYYFYHGYPDHLRPRDMMCIIRAHGKASEAMNSKCREEAAILLSRLS